MLAALDENSEQKKLVTIHFISDPISIALGNEITENEREGGEPQDDVTMK